MLTVANRCCPIASSPFTMAMMLGRRIRSYVAVGPGNSRRKFSEHRDTKKSTYIDQWFRSISKPQSWYDKHANASPIRRYFYNVDLQGRLFLEETLPKNIATSIKDVKFLDFFFRRIRNVNPKDQQALQAEFGSETVANVEDYPYVSPCGVELNFIRPAATPIVFHSLAKEVTGSTLVYAGTMTQPLDYARLAVSKKTGRLYHQLISSNGTKKTQKTALHDSVSTATPGYGLIRSSVAVSLSDRIVHDSDGETLLILTTQGHHPLPWLPEDAEPGPWALPLDDVDDE